MPQLDFTIWLLNLILNWSILLITLFSLNNLYNTPNNINSEQNNNQHTNNSNWNWN